MLFVPKPHNSEEELRVRADGRFGTADCFQWPQIYDEEFCYAEDICRLRQSRIDLLQGGAHGEMQRPEKIRDKVGISREFLKVSLGCDKIPCIV